MNDEKSVYDLYSSLFEIIGDIEWVYFSISDEIEKDLKIKKDIEKAIDILESVRKKLKP